MRKTAMVVMGGCAVVVLAAACAHPPQGPRLANATPPKLLGCASYTPPAEPWRLPNRFWVDVTVSPQGTVRPGSGSRSLSHHERGTELQSALRMAESCTFTPAENAGVPVEGHAVVEVAF